MDIRNAQYIADGRIDCEIDHPVYGWIPFTADPDDVEPLGVEVFNTAKDTAAPYVAPVVDPAAALAAWRANRELSKADFVLALVLAEILTLQDAIAAGRGGWPTALEGFLGYLTPEQSAQVQIEWATRTMIGRTDTYVLVLGSYLGLSDAQLDAMFGWRG